MRQAILFVAFAMLAGISAGRLVLARDRYRRWQDERGRTRGQRRLLWRQLGVVAPLVIASSVLLILLLRGPGVPDFALVLLVVEGTAVAVIVVLALAILRK